MTKHRKKGLILLAINAAILGLSYLLLKLSIGGLFPGLVMVGAFFGLIMVAVQYFIYEEGETAQSVLSAMGDLNTGVPRGAINDLRGSRKD